MNFKDFLGKPIDIGDYIFYSTTGRYPESRLCKVVRFTEKSMFVDIIKGSGYHSQYTNIRVQNNYVKVEYKE